MIIKISKIEYNASRIVQNADKKEAEIIIGARINTTKGLKTPPVKNNNPTNCEISNNKNKKVFLSVRVGLPL